MQPVPTLLGTSARGGGHADIPAAVFVVRLNGQRRRPIAHDRLHWHISFGAAIVHGLPALLHLR